MSQPTPAPAAEMEVEVQAGRPPPPAAGTTDVHPAIRMIQEATETAVRTCDDALLRIDAAKNATDADEHEMYPYEVRACAVRWRWRARVAAYALARGAATAWWTRDPFPAP